MNRRQPTVRTDVPPTSNGAGLRVAAIVVSFMGLGVVALALATSQARRERDLAADAAPRSEIASRDARAVLKLAAARADNEERIRVILARLEACIGDPDESKANRRLLEELGPRMSHAGLTDPSRMKSLWSRHFRASNQYFIEETERRALEAGDLEEACAIYDEALRPYEILPCAAVFSEEKRALWLQTRDRLATAAERWTRAFYEGFGRMRFDRRDVLSRSERASWFVNPSSSDIEVDWFDGGVRLQTGESSRRPYRSSIFAFDGWKDGVYDLKLEIEFEVLRGAMEISLRYRPDGESVQSLSSRGAARLEAGVRRRLAAKLIGLQLFVSEDGGPERLGTIDPSVSRSGGIGMSLHSETTVVVHACWVTVLRAKTCP